MESSRGHIHAVSGAGGQPGDTGGPTSSPPDPTPFLAALREASEHENHKEEVLGGKTRGVVTIAGAYFAVVQTAAFAGADTLGTLEGGGKDWVIRCAIGAVGFLALALAAAVRQQWPKKQGSLPSQEIGEDLLKLLYGPQSETAHRDALRELAQHYAGVTTTRHKANKKRLRQYYVASLLSLLAIAATSAELIVSLLSRTPVSS